MSTEPIIREIHTLSPGDQFYYEGDFYEVLTHLKFSVVTRHMVNCTRECMNLKTFKTKRIKFFERVILTSKISDQNSSKKP